MMKDINGDNKNDNKNKNNESKEVQNKMATTKRDQKNVDRQTKSTIRGSYNG